MELFYLEDSKRYNAHLLSELYNVSRSTFLNHIRNNKRGNAWWHIRDAELAPEVRKVFAEFNSCYGAEKISCILKTRGITAGVKKVRELMRKDGLYSVRQARKADYELIHRKHVDIVKHEFNAEAPNRLWFTDFLHVEHKGKFYSLCVILDSYARKVIAYRIGSSDTTNLLVRTFRDAWEARKPNGNMLVFHSDNGAAMSSYAFGRLLRKCGVTQSFSRVHRPCDNAVMESFFNTLRREDLRLRQYNSLEAVKKGIGAFVERYNNERPHVKNSYLTPAVMERRYFESLEGPES